MRPEESKHISSVSVAILFGFFRSHSSPQNDGGGRFSCLGFIFSNHNSSTRPCAPSTSDLNHSPSGETRGNHHAVGR